MSFKELKRHLGLRSVEAEMTYEGTVYWVVMGYTPIRDGSFDDFSYSVFTSDNEDPHPVYLDSVKPAPEAFVTAMEAVIENEIRRRTE